MLRKCLLLILILFSYSSNSSANETAVIRYNYALYGINLRNDKTTDSEILLNIPYGEKVSVLEETSCFFETDNIKGNWIKISYKGISGYVFNGYLSRLPAPRKELFSKGEIYSFKDYNNSYLNGSAKTISQKENDYLYKTYIIISGTNIVECFLLFRLIDIYPKIGLISLPQYTSKFKNKEKAVNTVIEVKRDKDNHPESIKILLDYYNSSGKITYLFEKYNQNDVKISVINELP